MLNQENVKDKNKIRNPVRTLSGVTPLTILTKPYPCPGRCAYCPSEKGMPKSYLSKEPAAARAKLSHFDPKIQIAYRLKQYENTHHPTDKIELIILGGTWSFYPEDYKASFIKDCYDALNGKISQTLLEAQNNNEKATHRLIGLTIETRPDFINENEIRKLREFGVTRVELGVQSVFEDILRKNLRDHGVKEIVRATKLLKESGFKINYHIMPGLPGSNYQKDLETFHILFEDPRFEPDMLKVYPCLIFENTLAYKWFQEGRYNPYATHELVKLGLEIKKIIPEYVRIMRFFRDIPKEYILAGSVSSNLRQMLKHEMEKNQDKCHCIRCREIRDQKVILKEKLTLKKIQYEASEGTEIFLQFVDSENRIYGFLRLRKNNPDFKPVFPCLENCALIRELHVYGQEISLKNHISAIQNPEQIQHLGLGKRLLQEAENISKNKWKLPKIAVISGIGVRPYYQKLGYHLIDTYMFKKL